MPKKELRRLIWISALIVLGFGVFLLIYGNGIFGIVLVQVGTLIWLYSRSMKVENSEIPKSAKRNMFIVMGLALLSFLVALYFHATPFLSVFLLGLFASLSYNLIKSWDKLP